MIDIKTPAQIAIMYEGGQKMGVILQELLTFATAGITLNEIEALAVTRITQAGGTPSFQTVPGYRWATCLCVNEVVVHGIPTDYVLKAGDVLTIDVGMLYKGFHTDTAWTKIIRSPEAKIQNLAEKERFLKVGEDAFWHAVAAAKVGNRVGHISQILQRGIEGGGYSVVRTLVGHGVGRSLHEEPQVPGVLKTSIEKTPELIEGMTIAIEIIYTMGSGAVVYENDDGWTISAKDRSLASVFEHSLAILKDGPLLLTKAAS
jgi:methionyl aminopeptidase